MDLEPSECGSSDSQSLRALMQTVDNKHLFEGKKGHQ